MPKVFWRYHDNYTEVSFAPRTVFLHFNSRGVTKSYLKVA